MLLEERDEQTSREGIARRRPVDGVDRRWCRTRDLLPVLVQYGAFGAQRHRQEAVASCHGFQLVLVHDGQVGVDRDRPCRCGIEAEDTFALLPRGLDGRARDLQLTQDRVVLGERYLPQVAVRARRDDDLRVTGVVDEDQRDARRIVRLCDLERDAGLPQPRKRFDGLGVSTDRADHGHLRAEPGARDGLIRTLPAGKPREGGSAERLARAREALAARHQVEVDRPDDGDAGRQAASARRSSMVDPRSVSCRSNSPAQRDERSGEASRLAAVASPSRARTSTASSR